MIFKAWETGYNGIKLQKSLGVKPTEAFLQFIWSEGELAGPFVNDFPYGTGIVIRIVGN